MADLPETSIHIPVPPEDGPAACEASAGGEGHPDSSDPFVAFTEWAGEIDDADYADL